MLKDKLKTLIKAVGGSQVKISKYAGIAAPNIGKITNGSRTPARKSSTSHKLGQGIYCFAEENGTVDVLCETIGCNPLIGEKKIRKSLLNWLYEDVVELDERTESFTGKLNDLISTVGISIPELSDMTGYDHSLLAAYRNGSKIPTRRSKFLERACGYLYSRARENNNLDAIAELTGIPENILSDEGAAIMIRDWLLGIKENTGNKVAANIIKQMTVSPVAPAKLPEFCDVADPAILLDDERDYVGISGLQRAVIRFLGNAAQRPGSELILYSDQSMEWMQARFTPKWQSLMHECLKNGVRMKIIHNIDRDPSEMIFALQSWLPIYMTGLIEPYYRTDTSGSRFCHTIFLSDDSCIEGFCSVGAERDCVYRYITDSTYISHIRRSYNKLLTGIKPLMIFGSGNFTPPKQYTVYDCGDVLLYISYKEAVVLKKSVPQYSFTIKHPFLINAFTSYAHNFGSEL